MLRNLYCGVHACRKTGQRGPAPGPLGLGEQYWPLSVNAVHGVFFATARQPPISSAEVAPHLITE